jgi:XTP/dITP diphosphohydrolase
LSYIKDAVGEFSMRKVIFATSNEGKMKEIREILEGLDIELLSMKDIGLNPDIEENGKTFEDNAIIKARTVMELTNELVLADDSGLEVDYMDKAPGVYSARFMGEETSYHIKNQYIIDQLAEASEEERSARFVCAIACAFPNGEVITRRATIEGFIAKQIVGTNGFGYDPIFYVPEYGCTTAQMASEIKNVISHRGKALQAIKDVIADYL